MSIFQTVAVGVEVGVWVCTARGQVPCVERACHTEILWRDAYDVISRGQEGEAVVPFVIGGGCPKQRIARIPDVVAVGIDVEFQGHPGDTEFSGILDSVAIQVVPDPVA